MALHSEDIAEFLIPVRLQFDASSDAALDKAMTRASFKGNLFSQILIDAAKSATVIVEKVGHSFRQLGELSERSGIGLDTIKQLQYAAQQMGSSYPEALAAVERIGQMKREGLQKFLDQYGGGDLVKLGEAMAKKSEPAALAINEQYFKLPVKFFLALLKTSEFNKWMQDAASIAERMGVDMKKAYDASLKFEQAMTRFAKIVGDVATPAITDAMKELTPPIKELGVFAEENKEAIQALMQGFVYALSIPFLWMKLLPGAEKVEEETARNTNEAAAAARRINEEPDGGRARFWKWIKGKFGGKVGYSGDVDRGMGGTSGSGVPGGGSGTVSQAPGSYANTLPGELGERKPATSERTMPGLMEGMTDVAGSALRGGVKFKPGVVEGWPTSENIEDRRVNKGMAEGGVINKPSIVVGPDGSITPIAEKGPEAVVPLKESEGGRRGLYKIVAEQLRSITPQSVKDREWYRQTLKNAEEGKDSSSTILKSFKDVKLKTENMPESQNIEDRRGDKKSWWTKPFSVSAQNDDNDPEFEDLMKNLPPNAREYMDLVRRRRRRRRAVRRHMARRRAAAPRRQAARRQAAQKPLERTGTGASGSAGAGGSSGAGWRGQGKQQSSLFAEKAPGIMRRLQKEFDLTKEEAAAVLGNLGHESIGFTDQTENLSKKKIAAGWRGGIGWPMWTNVRRRRYEKWTKEKGLDPYSDEANWAYMSKELHGEYSYAIDALKKAKGLEPKTKAFELAYEGAAKKSKGYPSRYAYARRAQSAYDQGDTLARANVPNMAFGYRGNNATMSNTVNLTAPTGVDAVTLADMFHRRQKSLNQDFANHIKGM